MAWGLEEENGEIYVIINGKKAISPESFQEFGAIASVDHGRTADELWIRFAGSKGGKRLLRTLYSPCSEIPELKNLERASNNAQFIKGLEHFSITKKNAARGRRRKQNLTYPEASNIEPPEETILPFEQEIVQDKKIGFFKVPEKRLTLASDDFRCREIDPKWVVSLKKSIRQAPGSLITTLPALLDPAMVSDPSQFTEEQLENQNVKIFLLGGNHVLQACREVMQEEPGNGILLQYQQIEVELYVGLTPEEAKLVGNIHNRKTATKVVQFQDQVRQARSVFLRDEAGNRWKDTARVILSHMQKKEYLKGDLSVVFGVASLPEESYREVERIFQLFDDMEVSQQLFKALLGFDALKVLQFLRRVEVRQDYKRVVEEIKREKKRNILRQIFQDKTRCGTWEEAERRYESHISIVEDYIDTNVNRKSVPSAFVAACDKAVENLPLPEIHVSIDVEVHVNGEKLSQDKVEELCGQHKRKLLNVVEMKLKKTKF